MKALASLITVVLGLGFLWVTSGFETYQTSRLAGEAVGMTAVLGLLVWLVVRFTPAKETLGLPAVLALTFACCAFYVSLDRGGSQAAKVAQVDALKQVMSDTKEGKRSDLDAMPALSSAPWVKSYIQDMQAITMEYTEMVSSVPQGALEPANLVDRVTTMQNRERIVSVVSALPSLAERVEQRSEQYISDLRTASGTTEKERSDAIATTRRSIDLQRRYYANQRRLFDVMVRMLDHVLAQETPLSVENGMLIFATDEAVETYNGLFDELSAEVEIETKLTAESLAMQNASIEKLSQQ